MRWAAGWPAEATTSPGRCADHLRRLRCPIPRLKATTALPYRERRSLVEGLNLTGEGWATVCAFYARSTDCSVPAPSRPRRTRRQTGRRPVPAGEAFRGLGEDQDLVVEDPARPTTQRAGVMADRRQFELVSAIAIPPARLY